MAGRSMTICRYCWPVMRSTRRSCAPRMPWATLAISSALVLRVARSSPKIFTAMSARTPVTISSTRSEMGWAMTICTPGSTASFSRILSAMVSWVQPSGHSSRGLSETMGVDSFCACGSAGDSPRPTPETAERTPGTSITSFMASISMRMDSSSEMLGTRLMPGTSEPSFISGMKALPRKGIRAPVVPSSSTAAATVPRALPMARCSSFR